MEFVVPKRNSLRINFSEDRRKNKFIYTSLIMSFFPCKHTSLIETIKKLITYSIKTSKSFSNEILFISKIHNSSKIIKHLHIPYSRFLIKMNYSLNSYKYPLHISNNPPNFRTLIPQTKYEIRKRNQQE